MAFRRRRDSEPVDYIVIGLGNPGEKYARTRHNVGAECVQVMAARRGWNLGAGRCDSLIAEGRIGEARVVLAVPITFMNASGSAAISLVRRFGLPTTENLIVVHDELDLDPAVVRVKHGGGLAGHNGLRDIDRRLGTRDFTRVRIGVGKPPSQDRGADHVLSKVPAAERAELDVAVEVAADAVDTIISSGVIAAMNGFNSR